MDIGTKVNGNYLGVNFSGVVQERRFLSVPTDGCVEHIVQLDSPMDILGLTRDVLVVNTLYDGAPSSYTRYQQWMKPVQ